MGISSKLIICALPKGSFFVHFVSGGRNGDVELLGFEDASAHQHILSAHHSPLQNKLTQNGHFFMRRDLLDRKTIV
jgi:hypothetical protein